MSDTFRKQLEEAVKAAVAKNLSQAFRGQTPTGVGRDVAESMSEVQTLPLSAMKKTDVGPVVLLDKSRLLGRYASDLRAERIIIPNAVPDYAIVIRDPSGSLVFAWRPVEMTVDEHEVDWRRT